MADIDESVSSPDGWLRVDFRISPGRMSHEIRSPTVVDTRSGKALFSLFADWDADFTWGGPGVVTLHLRSYAEGGLTRISVTIDAAKGEGRIDDGDWRPLEGLEPALEARFDEKAKVERAGAARGSGDGLRVDGVAAGTVSRVVVTMAGTVAILAIVIAAGYFYERHRTAKSSSPPAAIPKPTLTPPVKDYRRPEDRGK